MALDISTWSLPNFCSYFIVLTGVTSRKAHFFVSVPLSIFKYRLPGLQNWGVLSTHGLCSSPLQRQPLTDRILHTATLFQNSNSTPQSLTQNLQQLPPHHKQPRNVPGATGCSAHRGPSSQGPHTYYFVHTHSISAFLFLQTLNILLPIPPHRTPHHNNFYQSFIYPRMFFPFILMNPLNPTPFCFILVSAQLLQKQSISDLGTHLVGTAHVLHR